MSDPLRTGSSRTNETASDADRDAKIEQLLLAGLDHYFAGQYDQAVNVWTRVLFLDRSHGKARAYIERARSAMAERLRESEEILQQGVDAYQRGESELARDLLQTALGRGAPSDEALALLDRLDRVDRTGSGASPSLLPSMTGRARDTAPAERRTSSRWLAVLWGIAAALLVAGIGVVAPGVRWSYVFENEPSEPLAPPPAVERQLPMPRSGELALERARALADSGHVREALVALDGVRATDPERPDADQLRARLQRNLLALAVESQPAAAPTREPVEAVQP